MRLGKSPWNEITNKQGWKMRADIFKKSQNWRRGGNDKKNSTLMEKNSTLF